MGAMAAVAGKDDCAANQVAALRKQIEEREEVLAQKDARIAHLEDVRLTQDQVEKLRAMKNSARSHAAENTELKKKLAALEERVFEEHEEAIAKKDERIKHLEQVRLTKAQLEKLKTMKNSARVTAAENKELKQRLAELEGGAEAGGGGSSGGALAAANERNAELQGAKNNLMEKLKEYGKRVYDLEMQSSRVRTAILQAGVLAPEGRDLSDAVLEIAERSAGTDASVISSLSGGEEAVAAVAGGVAFSERHRAELQEARAALKREEAKHSALREQMTAGVVKFKVLEASEAGARERLEAAEAQKREAVNTALEIKEKDHERQLRFLQVDFEQCALLVERRFCLCCTAVCTSIICRSVAVWGPGCG